MYVSIFVIAFVIGCTSSSVLDGLRSSVRGVKLSSLGVKGDAKPGQFPFQVIIQDLKDAEPWPSHFCAGTIYNANTIITSANCVNNRSPENLQIVAGEYNLSVLEWREQFKPVSKIILHDYFNIDTLGNDIALLKLSEPLAFNKYVLPLLLPQYQDFYDNGECTMSGWGSSYSNYFNLFETMQTVNVSILATDYCIDVLGDMGLGDSDRRVCTSYESGRDSCIGDEGGPLTCLQNGYRYLAGVLSFDIHCADTDIPGVYTSVEHYIEWIQSNA